MPKIDIIKTQVTSSVTSVEPNFATMWEPKKANRFLVKLIDEKTKTIIIEPYLIKYIDRPSYTVCGGKKYWHTIRIRIYEPIIPQLILFRCLKAGMFDVQVNELGPVGDVIETWGLPHCKFKEVKGKPLDWTNSNDVLEIECELDWTEIIVKNGDTEFKITK